MRLLFLYIEGHLQSVREVAVLPPGLFIYYLLYGNFVTRHGFI